MSNVKVVKVDNLKLTGGGKKKSKKQPRNIEYLQNIVRNTKKENPIDLTQTELINKLLTKKSKKNMEVVINKKQETKPVRETTPIKETKPIKETTPTKETKPVKETKPTKETKSIKKPMVSKSKSKKSKSQISSTLLQPPLLKKKLPKKVGKKISKKNIMSFFSKEDQVKIKNKTKRVKKIISSNLRAPKIEKKTKKNFYKIGVRKILEKDKDSKKEISKMTLEQIKKELIKNGIIENDSNAPKKVLKDLYQLYLLIEGNISKLN